nr:MAG TPA: E3 UFM1-protein ligase 1 [Caudoviricetes sp.]
MEELREIKEKLVNIRRVINSISYEIEELTKEIDRIDNGEIDKTLDDCREIIEKYIKANGNILNKKQQTDLFKELRAVNKGRISLINLLKKLDINYSYQFMGQRKDIVINARTKKVKVNE